MKRLHHVPIVFFAQQNGIAVLGIDIDDLSIGDGLIYKGKDNFPKRSDIRIGNIGPLMNRSVLLIGT